MSLEDTVAPRLSFKQFQLPAGCEVSDHTSRIAAYAQNTWKADPNVVLGLLDLGTGARRVVLPRAVNALRGYSIYAPKLSDSWLAWEEVSPNEGAEPRNATWRLYAAPIDPTDFILGRPRLVDEGWTDHKLRPHFVVLSSTVFWSVNTVPSSRQEYVARSGSLEALDLATGKRRTLLRSSRSFPTLSASCDKIVVTEQTEPSRAPFAVRARVVDPTTGRIVLERDLANRHPVSHFVRVTPDWLAWAAFAEDGAEWPDLYIEPTDAGTSPAPETLLAGIDSIDPAFFGPYVAFESVEATFGGTPTSGMLRRTRSIWLADPARSTRARLLKTADSGGWWQTCAGAATPDKLVLWNDLGPWAEDPAAAATLVRVYTARQ